MTQEQALKAFQAIFPESDKLQVQRVRSIGYKHGYTTEYSLWDFSRVGRESAIVATSDRSWEHVLAIAKSGNDDCWAEEDGVWEDEQVSGK